METFSGVFRIRLLTALLGNGSQKSLPSNPLLGKPRPAGRPAGGRSSRTVVGGARGVSGAEKKNHLIEAAPFGRLDQMLRTTV